MNNLNLDKYLNIANEEKIKLCIEIMNNYYDGVVCIDNFSIYKQSDLIFYYTSLLFYFTLFELFLRIYKKLFAKVCYNDYRVLQLHCYL